MRTTSPIRTRARDANAVLQAMDLYTEQLTAERAAAGETGRLPETRGFQRLNELATQRFKVLPWPLRSYAALESYAALDALFTRGRTGRETEATADEYARQAQDADRPA